VGIPVILISPVHISLLSKSTHNNSNPKQKRGKEIVDLKYEVTDWTKVQRLSSKPRTFNNIQQQDPASKTFPKY
jgi:hypothetical protein